MDTNGEVFTKIALEIFKVSGLLNAEGDKLTEELGLSSARWKVMGAIEKSDDLVTVSQIARIMGQSRQATQRVTDIMVKDGLLTWLDNPNHKKAKLVNMTEKGKEAYALLDKKQEVWAESGAEGIERDELDKALITLKKMATFLDK
ncbi:DNA-binding MarR family transcriptional regulator [Vibrio crassostreae]|uniref:MarR family winged helix-turn-helix transcriptional regulator n=1 Tax=Vibrio crassostreae TaxID=246167 RepID=UPI000F47E645|nr:MarR family transcriptional regulator [Vibrio crassostreae]ROO64643.1 DNA-binding MarR family transcriptional regulator [Vibrio crassostreae]CAK1696273.1 DNA-binding MarR family transcriptional regulator [Vibrio crassostreae]CAK2249399.1 DNA-binding MarR family transcriptional regulator [Vibrio crassostreae]CAK2573704.1 DNA-binding MarR family transcriptional regulator [Vibrio crassostreae]CAK3209314.1 DNA-binding MarR family transcriptional regulator [Vibrio crassostreae]